MTISEKIISAHLTENPGRKVMPGELVVVHVDRVLLQDGTGPLAWSRFDELGLHGPAKPESIVSFLDHASPSPRQELANCHKLLRERAREYGITLSDIECGICHQRMIETFVHPGELILGSDSHTCTSGALGAFACGVGSTDAAIAVGLGEQWLRVPATLLIKIEGELNRWVTAKDIMLYLIGMIGADGGTYKALEFAGKTVEKMLVPERQVLCNMAVEAGAKTGIVSSDEMTKNYLREQGREQDWKEMSSDSDARYERTIEISAETLKPMVAQPHTVDNVQPVSEIAKEKVHIDQVFIGSCTGGRIEDLRIAAQILKGKKRATNTRLIITPASQATYEKALKEGILEQFVSAGGLVTAPGCGPCSGVHLGILADGEKCLATQNRNFRGRMGNPNSEVYLSSAAVAACSAIKGYIADPQELS